MRVLLLSISRRQQDEPVHKDCQAHSLAHVDGALVCQRELLVPVVKGGARMPWVEMVSFTYEFLVLEAKFKSYSSKCRRGEMLLEGVGYKEKEIQGICYIEPSRLNIDRAIYGETGSVQNT